MTRRRRPQRQEPAVYIERFWSRTARAENGCLEWQRGKNNHGYGQFCIGKERVYTHRFAWEVTNGAIPAGAHVLHRCDNPACCDPAHLFLGDQAANNRDKAQKGRNVNPLTDGNRAKTHCAHGHEFTPENTVNRHDGGRACRTCARANDRRRQRHKTPARQAYMVEFRRRRKEGHRAEA